MVVRVALLALLSDGRSARILVRVVDSLPVLLRALSDSTEVLGVMGFTAVADVDGSSFAKMTKTNGEDRSANGSKSAERKRTERTNLKACLTWRGEE